MYSSCEVQPLHWLVFGIWQWEDGIVQCWVKEPAAGGDHVSKKGKQLANKGAHWSQLITIGMVSGK